MTSILSSYRPGNTLGSTLGRPRRVATLAAAAILALGASAAAQDTGEVKEKPPLTPPIPTAFKELPSGLLGTAFTVILLALVVGVSLIPSKRGHQD